MAIGAGSAPHSGLLGLAVFGRTVLISVPSLVLVFVTALLPIPAPVLVPILIPVLVRVLVTALIPIPALVLVPILIPVLVLVPVLVPILVTAPSAATALAVPLVSMAVTPAVPSR